MARFHGGQARCDREILLGLRDIEQGPVVEPRARVLERRRRLEEGLKFGCSSRFRLKFGGCRMGTGKGLSGSSRSP